MDLKEFTKETLLQIVQGVNEANSELEHHNAYIPNRTAKTATRVFVENERYEADAIEVDFDVAVTATETEGTKGGGGIKVAQILLGGIEASSNTENQSISRVKYKIPLVLEAKNY